MCLAIPGKVVNIQGHKAKIQYPSESRDVLVGDDSIKIGDYVMVQMGIVIKVLSPAEVKETKKAWNLK